MSKPYVVSVHCEVSDPEALRKEAKRLAIEKVGMNAEEFEFYEGQCEDKQAYWLEMFFDHGSPLEHGVQIERTEAEVASV